MSTARDRLKAWASGGTTATPTIPASPSSTESAGQLSARDRLKAWATQGVPASVSAPTNQPTVSQPKPERVDYASQIADVDAEIKRLSNRNTTFDVSPFSEEENRQAEQRIVQLEQNKKQLQAEWQKQKDADVAAIDKRIKEVEASAAELAKRTDLDEYTKRLEIAKLNGAINQLVQANVKADPNAVDKAWAAASSIIAGVAGGLSAAGETVKEVATGKGKEHNYDPNSKSAQLLNYSAEQKDLAVSEASTGGKVLGETLIGIGQTAALSSLAAINPSLPLVAMAAVAAGNKANEVKAQGGTSNKALIRGAISGGIEAATEKFPLEALVDLVKVGGKSALKNLMKQAGMEATEESVSYVANWIVDKAFKDPNAKFSWAELGQAAAGGALSGGLMSGSAMLLNRTTNAGEALTTEKDLQKEAEKAGKKEVHYLPGTGPAANATEAAQDSATKAPASVSPVAGKQAASVSSAPSTAVMGETDAPSAGRVNPDDSVGAAPAGFTGTTKHGYYKNLASDEARHEYIRNEAEINPQYYFRAAHKDTEAKARAIMDKGLNEAKAILYEALGAADKGAKLPIEMIPLSKLVSDQLAAEGRFDEADIVTARVAAELTFAGQLGNAAYILREASPSAKIQALEKVATKIVGENKQLSKRVSSAKQIEAAVKEIEAERNDALNVIEDLISAIDEIAGKGFRSRKDLQDLLAQKPKSGRATQKFLNRIDAYIADEKSNGWVVTLSKELAKKAEQRASTKATEPTAYKAILSDLTTLMNQKIPNRGNHSKRSSVDRLRDMLANREEYARAWNGAVTTLKAKYAKNKDMLKELDGFLSGSVGYYSDGAYASMVKAATEVSIESNIKIKEMIVRGTYDKAGLASQISKTLANKVGATGSDAMLIRSAVEAYVDKKVSESKRVADSYIETDIKKVLKDMGTSISSILKQGAQTKQELSENVAKTLVETYNISEFAAKDAAEKITLMFNEMVSESSKRKLESMFKDRPERKQKGFEQRLEELVNLGAFSSDTYRESAANRLLGDRGALLDYNLAQAFANADTEESREKALDAVLRDIASKIPPSAWEQFSEIRKVFMLLTPKTQGRNFFGNAPLMAVRKTAEKLSGVAQDFAVKKGWLDEEDQTRTSKVSTESKALAKQLFEQQKESLSGAAEKWDVNGMIQQYRKYFGDSGFGKAADAVREFTYKLLERGDAPFLKSAFIDSAAQYMETHGIKDIKDMPQAGIDFATQQAMEATFKDFSVVASTLNKLKKNGVAGAALDVLFPFTTTPINVAKRTVEYSPVGLLTAMSKNKSSAEKIDALAKGLTGTGVIALGAFLAKYGFITGGADENKDKAALDKATGESPYSIAGKVSYEWAQPVGTQLAMGAAVWDAVEKGENWLDALTGAVVAGGDTIMDMTVFSNLKDLFSGYGSPTETIVETLTSGIASQMTPSLLGTVARSIDPIVRTTSHNEGLLKNAGTSILAKTPVASKLLPASVNVKGEETTRVQNPFLRALQEGFNPANVNTGERNSVDNEIYRLYDATGEFSVFPKKVGNSIEYDNTTIKLTSSEKMSYQETLGKTYYTVVDAMMDSDVYKNASAEEQVEYLKMAEEYATQMAKKDVIGDKFEQEKYVDKAKNAESELGLSEAEFLLLYEKYGDDALNGDGVRDAYASGLNIEDYLDYKTGIKSYDADRNKSYTIGETGAAIKASGLSEEDQVLLWLVEKPEWAEQASKIGVSNESYVKYKVAVNSIVGKQNSANIGKVIRALDIPQEDKLKLLAGN